MRFDSYIPWQLLVVCAFSILPVNAFCRQMYMADSVVVAVDSLVTDSLPADSLQRKLIDPNLKVDSTKINEDQAKAQAIDFDPTKYILQERYLPKIAASVPDSITFRTPHRWQQLYFGLSSGLYGLTDKEWRATNVPVSVFAGYEFNRYSALRLSGTYVQIPNRDDTQDVTSFGADLDYLFNVTSYINGYNPHRVVDFSLVPGIGIVFPNSHGEEGPRVGFKTQLAAHIGFHFGSSAEAFVEPYAGLMNDEVNQSSGNPAIYDVLYGVRLGAAFRLRPHIRSLRDSLDYVQANHHLFYEFAQGWVIPMGLQHSGAHTVGTGYQISLGEWIDPAFGFRASFAAQNFYWDYDVTPGFIAYGVRVTPPVNHWYLGAYFSGRLEAMVNPLNMVRSLRRQHNQRFYDLNIALGAEYGYLMKYGVPDTPNGLRMNCYGLTAAVQLLYHFTAKDPNGVSRQTGASLFIEPRISAINYHIPYANTGHFQAYTDKLAAVNVGMRIQRPGFQFRQSRDANFASKQRSFFASVSLIGARHLSVEKTLGDAIFNYGGNVSIGYEYAPLCAARLRVDYLRYGSNRTMDYLVNDYVKPIRYSAMWQVTHNLLTLKPAYMLNVMNLVQGYDRRRRLNAYIEVGPMLTFDMKREYAINEGNEAGGEQLLVIDPDKDKRFYYGGFAGLMADVRLNDAWSVQAETEMSIHRGEDLLGTEGGLFIKNWMIQCSVGAAYRFDLTKLWKK